MSQTDGRWTAKTPFPDLQQFLGADQFVDLSGSSTFNPPDSVATQLGAASAYALLAYSGITNTGNTIVSLGNVGSSNTTTITGFPPGVITAPSGIDNGNATIAQTALAAAITYYQGLTATLSGLSNLSTGGNGSSASTYTPGVYKGAAGLTMPSGIICDAQGNSNATFVFVAVSTINLASGQSVALVNGAKAENVVFVAGSSYTSVATSTMNGNVLAVASATLGGGVQNGRVLANTGAITISAATTVSVPVLSNFSSGLLYTTINAGLTSNFVKSLPELLLRSGVYASSAYNQSQFGTAADQPGPSLVAGTAGPYDNSMSGSPNYQGFAPFPASAMATLTGGVAGPLPKGIQIDSVDVIYQVLASATSVAATIGLTKTNFSNLVAPVVTNLLTLGNNGLPVVVGAQPQVTNVPVANPAMIVAADSEVVLNINLTAGLGGTIKFFGAVIKSHFNFA